MENTQSESRFATSILLLRNLAPLWWFAMGSPKKNWALGEFDLYKMCLQQDSQFIREISPAWGSGAILASRADSHSTNWAPTYEERKKNKPNPYEHRAKPTMRKWYMEYRQFEGRKKARRSFVATGSRLDEVWQLQALPNIRVRDIASCQDNKVISLVKGRSQKLNIGCKVVKSTFVCAQGCTSVC
jgi:hypothetical protein